LFSGCFFTDPVFEYLREVYSRISLGLYLGASNLVYINDLDFSCLRVVEFTEQYINPSLHEVVGSDSGQGVCKGGGRAWIARGYGRERVYEF
jgi:hypothetical protein